MPHTSADGPAIYYETSGDPSGQPLVLIAGASAQLIWWRDEFVQRLVDRGLFVIRPDNRDVGLSEKMGGPADVGPTYTIEAMADDMCRVLDALGLASAHIVGQSLGGAGAQVMAITRPERVRSMVLFYTIPAFEQQFLTDTLQQGVLANAGPAGATPPAPLTREQAIEEIVEREHNTRSTAYDFDEAWVRDYAARCYDRAYCADGVLRQVYAAMSLGDRRPQLRSLSVPTTVIHGRVDRLLKVEAGFEIGQLVPDAELHIYPGMGHELPPPLWDEFANIIVRTTARAS
jgi:pimeloyl-ACP methyl ester carboxylesterase